MTISQAGKNENGLFSSDLSHELTFNRFTLKKGYVRKVCDFLQDDTDIFQPYKFSIFMFF